MQQRRKYW